ncbi:NAD(P)/FAD-dependent oxidoreductase [Streptomyces sp. NPDC017941]|uniref:NAD(P)/FAD-dependent oxidoreductase n=1 Tax=Streptomyces sp. NPDC017941 TaxID=3365018 RepID=UPI0037AF9186
MRHERAVDVLIVGAGPAGLAAAAALAGAGAGRVEILEREQRAGGIPRHCHHGGFGGFGGFVGSGDVGAAGGEPGLGGLPGLSARRDLPGLRGLGTSGPQYAERCVDAAVRAGATLRTGVTVTGWAGPLTLDTTSPAGLERVTARAVVLATGARERPRGARLVPGTRPAGVYTTGELQQEVHLYRRAVGTRAVVVGAEPVAYAALDTLRRAGVEVAAQVTRRARHEAAPWRAAGARIVRGVPLLTGTEVAELTGRGRLSGVRLRHRSGRVTHLACDTVVFTGDFVPDNELARRGGVPLAAGTRGPAVDAAFRTALPGVFAAGNLLHAVADAGAVAAEGAAAAAAVRRFLRSGAWPAPGPAVEVAAPLHWVTPNRLAADGPRPVGGRFLLRATEFLTHPVLLVEQDGHVLHRERSWGRRAPGRTWTLDASWLPRADTGGGPLRVAVARG